MDRIDAFKELVSDKAISDMTSFSYPYPSIKVEEFIANTILKSQLQEEFVFAVLDINQVRNNLI